MGHFRGLGIRSLKYIVGAMQFAPSISELFGPSCARGLALWG